MPRSPSFNSPANRTVAAIFTATFMWCITPVVWGDSPATQDVRSVVSRIEQARSLLRSGIVRVEGVRVITRPLIRQEVEISDRHAFDLDRDLCRIDHDRNVSTIRDQAGGEAETKTKDKGGTAIYTADAFIKKPHNVSRIEVLRPEGLRQYWDYRNCGLASLPELDACLNFEEAIQRLAETENGVVIPSSSADGDGGGVGFVNLQFTRDFGSSVFRRVITINVDDDWSPIRLVDSLVPKGRKDTGLQLLAEQPGEVVTAEIDVVWKATQGVMLPTSLSARNYVVQQPEMSQVGSDEVMLNLVWESVNEELNEAMFSVESIDLPMGENRIVDLRSGSAIRVQDPSVPDGDVLRRLNEVHVSRQRERAEGGLQETDRAVWLLVVLNLLVALTLGGVYFRKKCQEE